MANYNTNHLEREIESLRRQLIKERDERQYEDAIRITSVVNQAEMRVLERCIVECMEEANAIPYSDEERIAILTAAERLKEMRVERVKEREERNRTMYNEQMRAAQNRAMQQVMHEQTKMYNDAFNRKLGKAMISGKSATHVIMDENVTYRGVW